MFFLLGGSGMYCCAGLNVEVVVETWLYSVILCGFRRGREVISVVEWGFAFVRVAFSGACAQVVA